MQKRFFAKHAKSSAALVSLGIHAVLIVIALSFVAVTVIKKEEQNFEAKPVSRPKMNLRKLQVPVNIKKKKVQKPKLRKRIVVQPKLNQSVPDIKMPEISGVKGGLGNAAAGGLGGAEALGFSMPEIEIFGVKGKGEKIILILGADADMMSDEMGGIPAFTIIKNEMIRIVEELPPTALFNVMIYDWKEVTMAFPNMVPATDSNAQKMQGWLEPLNAVTKGMGDRDFGMHTLGPGGTVSSERLMYGKFADPSEVGAKKGTKVDTRSWYQATMLAHKMGADTIFVLTDGWDLQRVAISSKNLSREEWDKTSAGKKWAEAYKKGLKLLDEENKKRREAGKPPKVLNRNEWSVNKEYFPGLERPPTPEWYNYTPKDFAEAFVLNRADHEKDEVSMTSGLKKKRGKIDFSFNVIQFVPKGKTASASSANNFKKLTSLCKGEYKTVAGMDEVQSYVTADPE
ncbi:hypothetical protein [Pontiella agarivorans]|uniref:VWFA domain-containing protein n=1 Tax=Pontiella agarivorans TaxID=3038953 RepID=A0ABU5MT20_9BACT|nr:hypothetical protein [Pontiella agarivorans]MDZ8117226.1 hypothetical protein [Pontiella agarivorans]